MKIQSQIQAWHSKRYTDQETVQQQARTPKSS